MLLITFLETPDWNQHMKGRSSRAASGSEPGGGGIVDAIAESFVNTFTKVHKPDKRFIEVSERAGKLTEDLNNVEKVTVRVARRQADLEQDTNMTGMRVFDDPAHQHVREDVKQLSRDALEKLVVDNIGEDLIPFLENAIELSDQTMLDAW